MNRYFYPILFFVLLTPFTAHAQCVNPPAEMGVIIFNKAHKVMQYCNGDDWIGIWGGGGGSGVQRVSGEVVAFDLANCPDGWSPMTSAQGRFIVGTGDGYARGVTGGAASVALTVAQLPAHNHTGTAASAGAHTHTGTAASAGAHTHTLALPRGDATWSGGSGNTLWGGLPGESYAGSQRNFTSSSSGAHTHSLTINSAGAHTHSLTIDNTGSGNAHENRPPYLALLYCRKD